MFKRKIHNQKPKNDKQFNLKLFFALCLSALVPTMYQTVRTFIVSVNISAEGFDIIGQMEWFDLINETLLAFIVIPLYSILNKISVQSKDDFKYFVFKAGILTVLFYALFHLGVFFYGQKLIVFMNPAETDVSAIFRYLILETAAFTVGVIPTFIKVVFIVRNRVKNVYILLLVQAVLLILSDFIMIPYFKVEGVALSNILTNIILSFFSILLLALYHDLSPSKFKKSDTAILKEWAKTGLFSGAQQFIDNIFYALMIGKMVNMVAEQGNYWLANNFIWGYLLVPINALAEIIKKDCAAGYKNLKKSHYYTVLFIIFFVWIASIPLWGIFYRNVEFLTNYQQILSITLKLFPFYFAYAFSAVPDNIFIGLGKTKYNAINSLFVNFLYYGIFFILYKTNILIMTMDTIIWMFGFGMVFHLLISTAEEYTLKKQEVQEIK